MSLLIDECLSSTTDYIITKLQPQDTAEAIRCLLSTFIKSEPMCTSLGLGEAEFGLFTRIFVEKAALDGLSVIARHPITHEFMGCIISEDMATEPPQEINQLSEKALPILHLLEQLDTPFLQKNPPRPGQFFHMFMCGVYKKFSGLQLTYKLTEASEKLAREKGYQTVLIEATGPVSQHVIKNKMNYLVEATLAYKEFSYEGTYPFQTISECTGCILFSKKL